MSASRERWLGVMSTVEKTKPVTACASRRVGRVDASTASGTRAAA
jgi:hypothetical protein